MSGLISYDELGDLESEHKIFVEICSRIGSRLVSRSALQDFLRVVGELHHHKEEYFLFPLALGAKELELGGPKCMTFFTPRVIGGQGWTDSFARLRGSVEYTTPLPEEMIGVREAAFRERSMLCVPLEDHIVGARAASRLLEGDESARNRLLSLYLEFLRDHIRREDDCLFVMIRRVLTKAQKEDYAARAAEFDRREGTREILNKVLSQIAI